MLTAASAPLRDLQGRIENVPHDYTELLGFNIDTPKGMFSALPPFRRNPALRRWSGQALANVRSPGIIRPVPTSLPMVVSPLRRVLERHGVEVVLVSIEVWSDEVVVRARGLPSERTAALEDEFSDALERWNRQGADKDAVPRQPADRIFDVAVSVADDAGTAYSPTTSARGGSGTMFRAEWSFVPGPPEAAQSLVVRIDGSATRIELDASR